MIVTWAVYKSVTGDTFTTEAAALANLARAQKRAEDNTGRLFDLVERTETLPIVDGKVWPRAYPIASVTVPDTATVDDDKLSITTGTSTPIGDLLDDPAYTGKLSGDREHLLVTYTGGYTADTAPVDLVDAICEIAQRYAQPANTAGVPAGANSVRSAGGQSYSGSILGGASALPLSIRSTLTAYRHIRVRMAD